MLGQKEEPLHKKKKVISKYDLISSLMIQDSRNRKDSIGFQKAVASAASNMKRRELSRWPWQHRVQHAGPKFGIHDRLPQPFASQPAAIANIFGRGLGGFKVNVLRYLGLGRVFQGLLI